MTATDHTDLGDLNGITVNTHYNADIVAMRFGLMCTLYVRNPHDAAVRQGLARCGDQYQAMFGEHLTLYLNPTGNGHFEPYPMTGVSLAKYVASDPTADRPFAPHFTGGHRYEEASPYTLNIWAPDVSFFPEDDDPGYFAATIPFAFLQDRSRHDAFQRLVHGWCKILKPHSGYAGIGAIQSVESTEKLTTIMQVYPVAKRFSGVEIENASIVSLHIRSQIKGVNWLTALSDDCLEPIGGRAKVLSQLDENFRILEYESGVLIQAGAAPQLGDVNREHTPRYYRQLSRIVKPLRMHFPEGHSFIRPGYGRSGAEASNEWLARFDDESAFSA